MRPEQIVFAVAPRGEGFDVLLGVPPPAWEYMKDGHTHTFDLTKLGLTIRIIMYGGPDQSTVRRWIDEHNRSIGIVGVQERGDEDFAIGPAVVTPEERARIKTETRDACIDAARLAIAGHENDYGSHPIETLETIVAAIRARTP